MTNERRSGLTGQSAVERLVTQAREKQEEQATDGRGRAGHGGKGLGRDKRGQAKMTLYISTGRQDLIREIAEAEEVAISDVAEAAVVLLYNAWRSGQLDLDSLKVATKSLKVLWRLNVPDEFGAEDPGT